MSLYELLSTAAALEELRETEEAGTRKSHPAVSPEEWEESMSVIKNLAQFDPSIRLE